VCSLCALPIYKGSNYVYRRYAPWECHPDGDMCYFTYKAHVTCENAYKQACTILTDEEILCLSNDPHEFRNTWLNGKSPYEEVKEGEE
jgi:hypothetical protein